MSAPTPRQPYEANKVMTIARVTYQPGDPVDVSGLPDHKVSQFLNQRRLRPSAPPQQNDALA